MSALANSLLATLVVSAISLAGILFAFTRWTPRLEILSLSFAAGVLLASTFLKVLPEAARAGPDGSVFSACLVAMVAFFLLERYLHGFHEHEETHTVASRYLILVGDGLHNFIDGIAIAASFAVDPAVGVATTVAVAAHEIPQEVADYGVLVSGGFSKSMALTLNFLSSLAAVIGAASCFLFEAWLTAHLGWLLAATGGMFIYIAGSDLIPELHHARWRGSLLGVVPFLLGIVLVALLLALVPSGH
ncbi:ZIP family metal transporter [Candidatus Binatia bacterium]|nr:ZIP family metal transporter [Candidatus Binatia bacterium]